MIDPGESIAPIGLDIFLYIILLLIGVNCTSNNKILEASFANPQIINVSLTVPLFIELGCRYKGWYGALEKRKIYILSGIAAYCCLRTMLKIKPFYPDVRSNEWGNLFEHILGLILTWHFLYVLGTYITKSKLLYNIFCLVSKNTLWIMALHMLALEIFEKIVSSDRLVMGYIKVAWAMAFPVLIHCIYGMLVKKIKILKSTRIKEAVE